MTVGLVAKAEIVIDAPVSKVWDAITNPAVIKEYMFGTEVVSEWKEGASIIWRGVWKDKPYEDKGVILKVVPEELLQYTHFSPLSGTPDVPESYHTLTFQLSTINVGHTRLVLSQDNNSTEDSKEHSQKMWETALAGMKKVVETV